MKYIELTQGKFALVDDEDYKFLNKWSWSYSTYGYAIRSSPAPKKQIIWLHRQIMNCPKGLFVDHINGNPLDNRKSNLRICSHKQNMQNIIKKKSHSSLYKGVVWVKERKKWVAAIHLNYKRFYIGGFENELHAAMAYDLWAIEFFGQFARTNFKVIAHSKSPI